MDKAALEQDGYVYPGQRIGQMGHGQGMTLRDYFAGQALQGIVSGYWANNGLSGLSQQNMADEAYRHADAMIKARTLSQAKGER